MGFRKPKAPKQEVVAAPAPKVAAKPVAPAPAAVFRGSNPERAKAQALADRALDRRSADDTSFVPFRRTLGAFGAALRQRIGG